MEERIMFIPKSHKKYNELLINKAFDLLRQILEKEKYDEEFSNIDIYKKFEEKAKLDEDYEGLMKVIEVIFEEFYKSYKSGKWKK